MSSPLEIIDQGAWVSKGKRSTQEDAYVLQEIHVDDGTDKDDNNSYSYVLAGVFDGHLGSAASMFVQNEISQSFRNELLLTKRTRSNNNNNEPFEIGNIIRNAWDNVCTTYREQCQQIVNDDGSTSCAAEYDPVNGILLASTGSKDAIAGTTAVMFIVDKVQRTITTFNCGDSRGLLIDSITGSILFQTTDHTPQYDFNRFVSGINDGYDYCIPKCSKRTNTWRVEVGDYDYAVARSLEGNFATSKGIVSTPDISTIPLLSLPAQQNTGSTNNTYILVLATDGFWEVIDSEEATKLIVQINKQQSKMSASEIAKYLCTLAIQKGSSDNVSVIIVFIR
jgi:serine/threonine protein phosphatase PrpC